MNPLIIGVRHHSPACARLVIRAIEKEKPVFVLIEGPADFNDRLDELFLAHELPIALYSYLSHSEGHRGSWTPFAEHSPEWQALQHGRQHGAKPYFMDLPSWSNAFANLENRYADAPDEEAEEQIGRYDDALAEKLSIEGKDALWDQLFEDLGENDDSLEELELALKTYFVNLRGETPGSLGNQAREKMMASWIAWAVKQNKGKVLVVCGGYHAPMLEKIWPSFSGEKPSLPTPQDEIKAAKAFAEEDETSDSNEDTSQDSEIRSGAYLVPYTFKKLDAFTGYASGMPSPGYYQWVWEKNGKSAHVGEILLRSVVERLRSKNLPASTADLISVHLHALALARLRGHRQPLRVDWLDALSGSLVKDALSVPVPWSYRGTLRGGTDPVLVEIMDVMAGNAMGMLAPNTPLPPLVKSLREEMKAHNIPEKGECQLNLFLPEDRAKSRVLHRMMILELPGVNRTKGPKLAVSGDGAEHWKIYKGMGYDAALIEAGAWGATLEDASRACLEAKLRKNGAEVDKLAEVLNLAAFAGLNSVGNSCLSSLQDAIATAQRFEAIGKVLSVVHTLFRYGQRLDMAGIPLLSVILESAFDRGLWLFELPGEVGGAAMDAHIETVQVMCRIAADVQALRRTQDHSTLSGILPDRFIAVLKRKAIQIDAAPVSRGASLGGLLILDHQPEEHVDSDNQSAESLWADRALNMLNSLSPATLGDALAGIVAVAREVLTREKHFISGLDQSIRNLDDTDFLLALPAMRSAFAWLPTQERGELADCVLDIHQAGNLSRRSLTGRIGEIDASMQAASGIHEKVVMARLAEWGIVLEGDRL